MDTNACKSILEENFIINSDVIQWNDITRMIFLFHKFLRSIFRILVKARVLSILVSKGLAQLKFSYICIFQLNFKAYYIQGNVFFLSKVLWEWKLLKPYSWRKFHKCFCQKISLITAMKQPINVLWLRQENLNPLLKNGITQVG